MSESSSHIQTGETSGESAPRVTSASEEASRKYECPDDNTYLAMEKAFQEKATRENIHGMVFSNCNGKPITIISPNSKECSSFYAALKISDQFPLTLEDDLIRRYREKNQQLYKEQNAAERSFWNKRIYFRTFQSNSDAQKRQNEVILKKLRQKVLAGRERLDDMKFLIELMTMRIQQLDTYSERRDENEDDDEVFTNNFDNGLEE